jgi:MFS family permease
MATLDSSIVNVTMPTLAHTFAANLTTIQWVSIAYLLTSTVLLLPFGRLGDARGRKAVFLAGLAVFTFGSALCGAAVSVATLVASRAVQGLGAAMIGANSVAIVSETFPRETRGRALGSIGAIVGLGLTVGPALGGWILDVADWRWIFLVNVPIGIVAILAGLRVLPKSSPRTVAAAERESVSALARSLVANRTFRAAQASLFLSFAALFVVVFLVPFYLQRVAGLGPGAVGRVLVVIPLTLIALSPASGALSDRFGTRALAVTGLALAVVGFVSFACLIGGATDRPLGVAQILGLFVVIGLGQAFFQPPNSNAAVSSVPRTRYGVAGGLLATMRSFGMLAGIGLAAAIYEGRETAYLAAGRTAVAAAGLAMRDAFAAAAVLAAIALAWTASAGAVVIAPSAPPPPPA